MTTWSSDFWKCRFCCRQLQILCAIHLLHCWSSSGWRDLIPAVFVCEEWIHLDSVTHTSVSTAALASSYLSHRSANKTNVEFFTHLFDQSVQRRLADCNPAGSLLPAVRRLLVSPGSRGCMVFLQFCWWSGAARRYECPPLSFTACWKWRTCERVPESTAAAAARSPNEYFWKIACIFFQDVWAKEMRGMNWARCSAVRSAPCFAFLGQTCVCTSHRFWEMSFGSFWMADSTLFFRNSEVKLLAGRFWLEGRRADEHSGLKCDSFTWRRTLWRIPIRTLCQRRRSSRIHCHFVRMCLVFGAR